MFALTAGAPFARLSSSEKLMLTAVSEPKKSGKFRLFGPCFMRLKLSKLSSRLVRMLTSRKRGLASSKPAEGCHSVQLWSRVEGHLYQKAVGLMLHGELSNSATAN